jgi:predicted Ser/Thr protein kinase
METNKTCPNCGRPIGPEAPQGLCPACLMKVGAGSVSVNPTGATYQGRRFEPPSVADLSRLFPGLEILDLIGRGGMGAVYKARQKDLDRVVALKILAGQQGDDPGFAERFTREARALARLNHPHIVAVYDFGQAGGLHYFIMEYVDGTDLRQVERTGVLSPTQALAIIPQICEALQFAHSKGIVHRDIKPENILLDREGNVKIADFGLVKILGSAASDSRLTQDGHVMGTPHYMAPEQVEHPQEVDHRADIYSLGVVFYEMLTGELPLGRFALPSQKVHVDVRLDEVVLHALEKEPQRRYQQASQVKTDVETIAGTPGSAAATADNVAGATPADWRTYLKARFWPPLVGRRLGQRVINWPAVAMRAIRSLFVVLAVAIVVASVVAQNGHANGLGVFAFIAGLGAFLLSVVMAIRILRGFAVPLDLLQDLESPQPLAPRRRTSPMGPRMCPQALAGAFITPFVPFSFLLTPLNGWMAIERIRRSAGLFYGMGLAVFDLLVFPLLALDFAVIGLPIGAWVWMGFDPTHPADADVNTRSLFMFTAGASAAIAAALDVLIVRGVWRAVNRPLDSTGPQPSSDVKAKPRSSGSGR